MSEFAAMDALTKPSGRALADNLLAFARLLRRTGLRVGTADVLAAADALSLVDIADRRQVHAALRGVMVRRHEDFAVFDQAFLLFWRDPEAGRNAAAMAMLEGFKERQKAPPTSRRVAEAMTPPKQAPNQRPPEPEEKPPIEVAMTVSERERLQSMDFEAMSATEIAEAKREIGKLVLPLDERRTRRFRPDPRGPVVDLRATIRASLHEGGEILALARKRQVTRPPPLVALCDISGSMARYAQILLHFLHAVTNDRDRVSSFLFGTRLTNVTRQLKSRDPEVAFELVSHVVPDWSGGTRIGESLELFNRHWSRRVLGQGAVVLLITDGLDREGAKGLAEATDRLRHSCRRLIWLNPLLRYEGFQPKSQGIRAMLPHVDDFRPVHNLQSLRSLVETLSGPQPVRRIAA
ncbi:vWA domain-containing protein [Paracraurococcus ruber]|uniref:VWA domain-containing protein n=1 Tax=Paracraurococcus ruber TaxID=77675 RepID=A0ABS1D5P0_9PROT|nr:VWA domain-containing protein [Paracraurococcus ruber]MBK1662198.1 VWA domain-containing protein [Paracraurococcus ruber]TDG31604.1 VWA domain-containing protein [Paracraurococcus ruber]